MVPYSLVEQEKEQDQERQDSIQNREINAGAHAEERLQMDFGLSFRDIRGRARPVFRHAGDYRISPMPCQRKSIVLTCLARVPFELERLVS